MFEIDYSVDMYCKRTAGRAVRLDDGFWHIEWANEKGQKWTTGYRFANYDSAAHAINSVLLYQ